MTKDRIIERVQKLLNLAGNNPSDAERDAAMAKALAMLAENNLSMEEIKDREKTGEDKPREMFKRGRSGPWIKILYQSVGELYFCKYFYVSYGKDTVHYFVGQPQNCAVAHEMAHWISEGLWKQGLRGKRERGARNTYLTSFLNAAATRVHHRVKEIIEQTKKGASVVAGTNLPVLASFYDQQLKANEQFIEKQHGELKTRKNRMSFDDHHGIADGRDAADRINLQPQVGKTDQGKIQ